MNQHVLLCLMPNHTELAERILLGQKSLVMRTHDLKPKNILAVAGLTRARQCTGNKFAKGE